MRYSLTAAFPSLPVPAEHRVLDECERSDDSAPVCFTYRLKVEYSHSDARGLVP